MKYDIIDVVHPDVMENCMDRCRRRIGVSVEHMLKYPEITEAIRKALEPLVEQNKKIIVYPYGGNGRLCELMLIYLFHYNIDAFVVTDFKDEKKLFGKPIYKRDYLLNEGRHYEIILGIANFEYANQVCEWFITNRIYHVLFYGLRKQT